MNRFKLFLVLQWVCIISLYGQNLENIERINVDSVFSKLNQDSISNREIGINARRSGDTITLNPNSANHLGSLFLIFSGAGLFSL